MRRVEISKSSRGTTYLYENGSVSYIDTNGVESNRFLKLSKGYLHVRVIENSRRVDKSVHRLVATHFLPKDKTGLRNFVNHKNGIKTDNSVENLEWCTPSENNLHARDVLGVVEYVKWFKINIINLDILEECESTNELGRRGISVSDISAKGNTVWITENLYLKGELSVRDYIKTKSPKYNGKGLRKYSSVMVSNIKRLSRESTLTKKEFAKSIGIDRKIIRNMNNGQYEDTSYYICSPCYYSGILKIFFRGI